MLETLKVGGEGDNRRWDGWMASSTRWTWVWTSSGRWWWMGKPGMEIYFLQFGRTETWHQGASMVRYCWRPIPGCRQPHVHCILMWQKKMRELPEVPLIRALILFLGTPPNHSTSCHFIIPSYWELGFQCKNFWREYKHSVCYNWREQWWRKRW